VIQTADSADTDQAGELRRAMADRLLAQGWISSPAVEAAFRAVPRHLFVPTGTPLDMAYATDAAPVAKTSPDGVNLSTVSAPWLQARMIAQAGIEPGMRVLEIGSGGYNAALLAEVTGRDGLVVTVDIDPDITAFASVALKAAGYGDRVRVVTADGEHGYQDDAPYDAIIVTVQAWDIPPAWTGQLVPGGTLVVPLRMNLVGRSLAFRRESDRRLASLSAELCGFVPMQGTGAHQEHSFRVPDPGGGHVTLRFDQSLPDAPSQLEGALASGPVTEWSGVTIPNATSFEDLHLWLASFLPGFCKVGAGKGTALASLGVSRGWFPYGAAHGDSFCYQASRRLGGDGQIEFEFGAGGYGPRAANVAAAFNDQVRHWDASGRDLPGDAFAFWPAGTEIPDMPGPVSVFPKAHGTVTVSWADAARRRVPQAPAPPMP